MKKFFALFLTVLLILSLTACNKNQDAEDNPLDVEQDFVNPDEKLDNNQADPWAELININGFISNEAAYAKTRSEWHDIQEPDVSQVTYYEDFQADCYLYISPDESYGHFIELDYELAKLDSDPTPDIIKLVSFNSSDAIPDTENYYFENGIEIFYKSSLEFNKHFFGKPVQAIIDILGEPVTSDLSKWGYGIWYIGDYEFSVYLDADSNILYMQRQSVWDAVIDYGVDEDGVEMGDGDVDAGFGGFAGDGQDIDPGFAVTPEA